MKRLNVFQEQLLNEFFDISEAIRDDEDLRQEMLRPTGERPMEDIIENNLEEIMAESVVYESI